MSTILNALQKQSREQAYNRQSGTHNNYWKVMFFAALLLIITLLTVLVFMQLKPQILLQAEQVAAASPVIPEGAPLPAGQKNTRATKQISKVAFQTRHLPQTADKTTAEDLETSFGNVSQAQAVIASTAQAKPQEEKQEIDYSDVSEELQQRFERALLMSEDQGKALIASEHSDGTDLYQMASAFQAQVAALSYDFHVYSSVPQERWIRINGEDLVEGQFDRSGEIQVVEIQPNRTVFRLGTQSFSLQSLTDWQGL